LQLLKMWGPVSELDIPYDVRRIRAFPEKFQRSLSEREKMLIAKVKEGVYDDVRGITVPNLRVLDDFKCPKKEKQIVMDEVSVT
jgi:hypothetical protein